MAQTNQSRFGQAMAAVVLCVMAASLSPVVAFGPGLDREKLAGEEARVAELRESMDGFGTFAIAKLHHLANISP